MTSRLTEARRSVDGVVLSSVRASQAAVVALLDRAVDGRRARQDGSRNALARLLNLHLEVLDLCLGDAASAADETFRSTVRLVGLHREFVQRVLEAVDTRAATLFLEGDEELAPVVHLDAGVQDR